MNQARLQAWSDPSHADPMVSAAEDEFTNFLELGTFNLDFQAFGGTDGAGMSIQPDGGNSIDTRMDDVADTTSRKHGLVQQNLQEPDGPRHAVSVPMMPGSSPSADVLMAMNMQNHMYQRQQQHQQHQRQQQQQQQQRMREALYQQRQNVIIPPTPNSVEMHGGAAQFYHQMDPQSQALMDNYQRKDDQMVFTPLVSPAVTPLDAQFAVPEYTVPGAYFSPITSPALDAQQHSTRHSIYYNPPRSDTSLATSPIDMSFDLTPTSAASASSLPPAARRTRRTMSNSRPPARVVRQSPSMKPQRRKATTAAVKPLNDLNGMAERPEVEEAANSNQVKQNGQNLQVTNSHDSSASESISPEPLSEILMAPPPAPKPGSANRSPYLMARNGSGGSRIGSNLQQETDDGSNGSGMHPATPASLMRLEKQPSRNGLKHEASPAMNTTHSPALQGADESPMEDLTLPEAASLPRPSVSRVEKVTSDGQTTPTSAERKTPRVRPLSISGGVPLSASQSPIQPGLASPMGTPLGKKTDGKAGSRGGKRRNTSTSSVQVSPALRPKISPSIKPLLPDGAVVSAETSALFLASKSNYQNILEGNHLPGVSYPEALSTNLTSKRTSHKIAEQGRRNRINNALLEIAALLPSTSNGRDSSSGAEASGNGGSNGTTSNIASGTAAQQSNSKASTVEMAIEYIKALQSELAETKGRLETAEKKLGGSVKGDEQSEAPE